MVIVNCGAIPEGIIESELFGHKKVLLLELRMIGKDILRSKQRYNFLDEIGEAPLETQVKLLRVLETGEYMRVGTQKLDELM